MCSAISSARGSCCCDRYLAGTAAAHAAAPHTTTLTFATPPAHVRGAARTPSLKAQQATMPRRTSVATAAAKDPADEGHASAEAPIGGWFRKRPEKRGRTRTRYLEMRDFSIPYYADHSEHRGPTGCKGEIPLLPNLTLAQACGRGLLICNPGRVYDLDAVSGPLQATMWARAITQRVASLPNAGWFIKAAEAIGKDHLRYFLLSDDDVPPAGGGDDAGKGKGTRIDYFVKSGVDGRGDGHRGTIPVLGSTIALPHGRTLFIYGENRTWELTATLPSEAERWAAMIQERARRLRHGSREAAADAVDDAEEQKYTERARQASEELMASVKKTPGARQDEVDYGEDVNDALPPLPPGAPPASAPARGASPPPDKSKPPPRDLYTTVDNIFLASADGGADGDYDPATVMIYVATEDGEDGEDGENGEGGGEGGDRDDATWADSARGVTRPSLPPRLSELPPRSAKAAGGKPYATTSRDSALGDPYAVSGMGGFAGCDLTLLEGGDAYARSDSVDDGPERTASVGGADAGLDDDEGGLPRDWGNWEIERSSLELESVCGSGEFGEVWAGRLIGSGDTAGLVAKIAAKCLKAGAATEESRAAFLTEARHQVRLHHANIINLYGVCTIGEPVLIVSEFAEHGSLDRYLRRRADGGTKRVGARALLRFTRDCCAGMAYLEANEFVHRDLAARNVLLDAQLTCKVSDFGLAKDVHGLENNVWLGEKGARIPVRWCSPEALRYQAFSTKSDVWAFGVLVWEIFTHGREPYEGLSNKQVCRAVIKLGYVLARPPGCPAALYDDVLVGCWRKEPADRPSFRAVLADLRAFAL